MAECRRGRAQGKVARPAAAAWSPTSITPLTVRGTRATIHGYAATSPVIRSDTVPIAPAFAMPVDRAELYAAIAESRRAAEEDTAAARFRVLVWAGVQCLAWCALGLLMMGWSMHTTDLRWARPVFLGGIVVGNAGILATIVRVQAALDRAEHA